MDTDKAEEMIKVSTVCRLYNVDPVVLKRNAERWEASIEKRKIRKTATIKRWGPKA